MLIVTTNRFAEIETKLAKINRCVIPGTGVWKVRRRIFFITYHSIDATATQCCRHSLLLSFNAAVTWCCRRSVLLSSCCCRSVLLSFGAAVTRCCCRSMLLSLGAAVTQYSCRALEPCSSFLHSLPCSILPQWPLEPTPAPSSSLLATRMHRSGIRIEINNLHMKLSAKGTYA